MGHARNQRRLTARSHRPGMPTACHRCGSDRVIGTVSILAGGQPVCHDCLRPEDHSTGELISIASESEGAGADREWFAANPQAEWRLREVLPGEISELAARHRYAMMVAAMDDTPPSFEGCTHVVSLRLNGRLRARHPVSLPSEGVDEWLTNVVLPQMRKGGEAGLAHSRGMTPVARELGRLAGAFTGVSGESFWQHAAEQGQAMRERRNGGQGLQ